MSKDIIARIELTNRCTTEDVEMLISRLDNRGPDRSLQYVHNPNREEEPDYYLVAETDDDE